MNKNIFPFCLPILFSITAMVVEDLRIPGNDFVEGWEKTDGLRRFQESDLFNYINGGAEIFHEFGFEVLFVQHYGKGDEEITLEIYQMESPESALGIYLYKCGNETPIPNIATRHSGNRFQFTVLKNKFYIVVNNATGNADLIPVMTTLVNVLLTSVPGDQKVELLDVLPQKGLVDGSVKIIRGPVALEPIFTFGEGDILKLGGQVFGLVGDYRQDDESTFSRILIPYPDGETAHSAYSNLTKHLDAYIEVLESHAYGFIFKDYQDQFGIVIHRENVIDIRIHISKRPAGIFQRE